MFVTVLKPFDFITTIHREVFPIILKVMMTHSTIDSIVLDLIKISSPASSPSSDIVDIGNIYVEVDPSYNFTIKTVLIDFKINHIRSFY